jgi:uncharacterized protein YceK
MRKIVLSLVMVLLLAGSSAFASQNKDTSRGEHSGISAHHGRGHHRRHHRRWRHYEPARGRSNKNM